MARINFNTAFAAVSKLFKTAKKKHTDDGPASVLVRYLNENSIDLNDDETAMTAAAAADKSFNSSEKLMEEKRELRDKLFDPAFGDHKKCVQFLKKFYRAAPHKLGDWTVTVDGDGRISYPPDFTGQAQAVLDFIDHFDTTPSDAAILQPFLDENEIDLAANKTATENAQTAHDDFQTAERDKEQFRAGRDLLTAPVTEHLRGIGQFLITNFASNPKKAGQWGYVVDDSPQADRTRDVVVTEQSSKVLQQLAVGKIVANIGQLSAKIFKGKTASGTPIVLDAGQKFTVTRGFGTITVVNESNTGKVTIEATFNR